MTGAVRTLGGLPVFVMDADGPLLDGERAATDVIGEMYGSNARTVAIPLTRLAPGFLELRTRIAGEVTQKFVNYGVRPVFVGDVSQAVAGSDALRDYVRECNRGRQVWFVADLAELEARLAGA